MVLRPGPYICGERDWGGFPAWLSTVPGLTVRTYNEPYLNYSTRYLERLAADLRHLQVTEGGPILMVQVENEVSCLPITCKSVHGHRARNTLSSWCFRAVLLWNTFLCTDILLEEWTVRVLRVKPSVYRGPKGYSPEEL